MRHARPTFLHFLMSLTVLGALTIPTAPAAAQGTSGALPGPINSQQLSRYAERLGLSPSQRLAIDAAHDDYRREFRLLRDGEIAAFLQEQQAVQGGIPQRKVVEELLDKVEQLQAKIALLDNRLFDQMLPVLSEAQQALVPRLRLDRERGRYEGQVTAAAFGRRTVDLSDLVPARTVTAEQAAAIDSVMAMYERRLTRTMHKQYDAVTRMSLDMMDILADRGYGEVSQEELLADPELLQKVLNDIRGAYTELRAGTAELAGDLRTLNDKTFHQVASMLPEREALRFRNDYYRGTHPQLGSLLALSENEWMTKALELPDLPPEQREVLESLSRDYQDKLGALLDDGVEKLDEFWTGFSPLELNQERGEKLRADLSALQTKAGEATEAAHRHADELLGEAVADLRNAANKLGSSPATPTAVAGDETSGDGETEDFAFSGDRFLPERISRRDIRRFSHELQLERDMSEVLDALHRDYLERLRAMTEFDALRDARAAVGAEEGPNAETPVKERIDRVYSLRRQAIEAMVAADSAFFADLGAIVGEVKRPLLDLVARSRLRRAYTGSASTRMALGRDNTNEASVDLVSILLEEQPTDDELASLKDVVAAYEADALDAFRARLEAQLALQKLSDQWQTEIEAAAREDIAAVIELQGRYRDDVKEPTRRVERTDEVIVELNRRTLEAMVGVLSSDRAVTIRHAYELAAFPSIYDDPASVQRHLTAALELEDLTARQRETLSDLSLSYRTDYDRLTHEMIDHLGTGSVSVVGLDPEAFREWQQRQQELTKIRFDRNELNGRAISRMRAALTPEQIVRLGGLPEPLGEDDFYFYR